MKEHYGIEPPVSLVANCCMRAARELVEQEPLEAATALPASGADRLLLEIDGTMAPVILEQSAQGDRRKNKRLGYKEMRLAAARDLEKSDAVYAAGFYSVEEAGNAWSRCARQAGWSMSTQTHAVVDGAEWIRSQHDAHFSRFGMALSDCYHVCEYLRAAFGDDADYRRHKASLLEERIEDTLRELAEMGRKNETDPSGETPAGDALRYLRNRYDSLFYAQAREQGLPIGSGLIEGGHRHILQSRLKISGAWWKQDNANAMAKLRVAKQNGQWDQLWQRKVA